MTTTNKILGLLFALLIFLLVSGINWLVCDGRYFIIIEIIILGFYVYSLLSTLKAYKQK